MKTRKAEPTPLIKPLGVRTQKSEPLSPLSFFTSATISPLLKFRKVLEDDGSCKNLSTINSVCAPSMIVVPLENTSTPDARGLVLTVAACGTWSPSFRAFVVPFNVIVTCPFTLATRTTPGGICKADA
jgi:hypothetical protein